MVSPKSDNKLCSGVNLGNTDFIKQILNDSR